MSITVLNRLKPYDYYEGAFLILDKDNIIVRGTACRDIFGSIMIHSKLGTRTDNCVTSLDRLTSTSFVILSTLSLEEMQKFFIAIELLADIKCRHTIISSVKVTDEELKDRKRFDRLGLNYFHIDLSPFWFKDVLNLSSASLLVKIMITAGSLVKQLFKGYKRSLDLSMSNYIHSVLDESDVSSSYYKNHFFDFNLVLDIICNPRKYGFEKPLSRGRDKDTYNYFTYNGVVSQIRYFLEYEGGINPTKGHTERLIEMFTEAECQNRISKILDAMNAPVVTQ
jgi:hypothetical protein